MSVLARRKFELRPLMDKKRQLQDEGTELVKELGRRGSAGLTTVTCTITANDTNDCIKVEVNGVIATNLRYTAYLVSTEVLYA